MGLYYLPLVEETMLMSLKIASNVEALNADPVKGFVLGGSQVTLSNSQKEDNNKVDNCEQVFRSNRDHGSVTLVPR